MNKLGFIFILLLCFSIFSQGPLWGTAVVDDPYGMHINPGYLGIISGFETATYYNRFPLERNNVIIQTYPETTYSTEIKYANSWGVLLNLGGLAGGYEDLGKVERWTLGAGIGDRTFGIGYLRTWSASKDWGSGWRNGWIFGAMLRPFDFLSLGWAYEKTPALDGGHRIGIGFRPKTWRATFFGDITKPDDIEWEDLFWGIGGELHIVNGVRFFGRYDRLGKDFSDEPIEQFSAGFRFDNPLNGTGIIAKSGTENDWEDFTLYQVSSSKRFPSLIPMPKKALQIVLSGDYSERPAGGLFAPKTKSFASLVKTLERASEDPEVTALVIKWEYPGFNFAQAEELRAILMKFKSNKKKIYFYATTLGNLGYYVASPADFIAISPTGAGVNLIGLRAELTFLRGTLDKLGITPDFLHAGEYKSAAEMFTRKEPSEPSARNIEEILDEYQKVIVEGIAEGRNLSSEKIAELINAGPYTDIEAESLGLVDTLVYWDEFENYIKKTKKIKATPIGVYSSTEAREMRWGQPDRIAVIVIDGNIIHGQGGSGGLFGGNSTGDKEIVQAIQRAKNDRSVKGILIRVSSGGGSAVASDLMTHAISDAAKKKPVVISMGNAAASGGYFVSTPGKKIFADKTTLTGSIGVIMGKFSLKNLYEKIGISKTIFSRGEHSGIYSLSDTFTTAERERMNASMGRTYNIFKSRVAEGRGISIDSVETIARGRVWMGEMAKEIGIIDSIGGFMDALNYLVEISKADKSELEIVLLPQRSGLGFPDLMGIVLGGNPLKKELEKIPDFPYEDGEMLYLLPYIIEIK